MKEEKKTDVSMLVLYKVLKLTLKKVTRSLGYVLGTATISRADILIISLIKSSFLLIKLMLWLREIKALAQRCNA